MRQLKIDYVRILDGMARLSHSVETAVLDLVDNSIAAGATSILIEAWVERRIRDEVEHFQLHRLAIADNGRGMDDAQTENALALGSDASNYGSNSLSKFGLGLKASAMTVGNRLQVWSTQQSNNDDWFVLDRNLIAARGGLDYFAINEPLPPWVPDHILNGMSDGLGTWIVIEADSGKARDSWSDILDALKGQIPSVYMSWLADSDNSIRIKTRHAPDFVNSVAVENLEEDKKYYPFSSAGDVQELNSLPIRKLIDRVKALPKPFPKSSIKPVAGEYDFRTMSIPIPVAAHREGMSCEVDVEVQVFPMKKFGTQECLDDEPRQRTRKNKITIERCGIYVYRNGRLLKIDNAQGKKWPSNVRVRISYCTENNPDADSIFNVDVSKTNASIPPNLKIACIDKITVLRKGVLKAQSDLFEALAAGGAAGGADFNGKNVGLLLPDTDHMKDPPPQAAAPELDKKIRYRNLVGDVVVLSEGARLDGSEILTADLNLSNVFVNQVESLKQGDCRLRLEAVLWAVAVAEYQTLSTLHTVPIEHRTKTMARFQQHFSRALSAWSEHNDDAADELDDSSAVEADS